MDAFEVLLIGGASGTGKSQVSYPLARQLGISVLETDDLVTAIKAATTPRQLPLLHYWDTHPEALLWPARPINDLTQSLMDSLVPVFAAIIADHVDTGIRIVLEGDHLLPSLMVGRPGVRGVILHEPDTEQVVRNFARREPEHGEQPLRAEVSVMRGAALTRQAGQLGVPVIAARPWTTALARTAAALGVAG
jgi:2-phosphoglycerate kinase